MHVAVPVVAVVDLIARIQAVGKIAYDAGLPEGLIVY